MPRSQILQTAVSDLIAAQARQAPDRMAITWRHGAAWTYAELMEKADAIAQGLLGRGVARGELVGVYMPRRPEMVAAVLGILRAGAAYVPLEQAFPDARLAHLADHTGIRQLLVWRNADVPDVLASRTTLFPLDGFDPGHSIEQELPVLTGADLAYVLFTSGSTGQPKGVRILHRNLVNDLVSLQREPGISADDIMGAFTNLSFDPSVHEIFLPLLVGARIVIATEVEQVDPKAATQLMRTQPMTMLQSSPVMLRLMLDNGRGDELQNMKLWVGGEALPRDLAESILPRCGELWNMYGPTEATVEATIQRVTHGPGPIPIGKPIDNVRVYLLDDTGTPVPDNELGEIWIGGAGVADGYLGDPARTAERFFPDPFAADGSRMYRTGDLGRLRDGLLYFHGRVDDQINLHGARIEPGEIEAMALAEAGIHQAVAMAREVDQDLCLVLYVVADPDPDLITQLRVSLRSNLPVIMLPRYVVRLDTMPMTPNGKIDRKALPLPRTSAQRDLPPTTGGLPATPTARPAPAKTRVLRTRTDAGHGASWSPLVPIQPRGQRPPLFLVHAIGGKTLNYIALARGLGADQPVYGVQALGLDGTTSPVGSLQAMAACYVTEIQRIQPHGPYFLGGGSMGGLIAYEMAQQLYAQNEPVALLAMMDTSCPGHASVALNSGRATPSWPRRLLQAIDAMRIRHARAGGRALPHGLRTREMERVHFLAMRDYRAQSYAGRAVLFQAMESPANGAASGWSELVRGGIEVFDLPGNHETLIEQPTLLRELRRVLEDAQADHARPKPPASQH